MERPKNHEHLDFSHLRHLKWFQIGSVETYEFLQTISDNIEVLQISNISTIDAFFDALVKSSCRPRTLDVTESPAIVHFDAKSLCDLTNLKHLVINKCGLKTVYFDNNTFLSNLESVDLSENSLLALSFFKPLYMIELSLSGNENLNLRPNMFSGLNRLEILKLHARTRNECSTDYLDSIQRSRQSTNSRFKR